MNLHVVPFTKHTPIDLSQFQITADPSDLKQYESFIIFTYKDTVLPTGLRANIIPRETDLLVDPISKVYCKGIASYPYNDIVVEHIQPDPLTANSEDSNELDCFANKFLTTLEDRASYYKLTVQEAIGFLLEKQDPTLSLTNKLTKLIPGSTEYNNIINYLQILKDLPTKLKSISPNCSQIQKCINELPISDSDADALNLLTHYSLLTRKTSLSPILLSGPPGIGKTTFAYNLGLILNVPVATCSLSGITDRHHVTGFLRSYANSSPGIIIQELIKAKCLNPVIIVDEIDKASKEIQDSFLALLDPVQNTHWVDSYINIPIDVSNITWVFTSNNVQSLSKWFRDRLLEVNLRYYSKSELIDLILHKFAPETAKNLNMKSYTISARVLEELSNRKSLRDIQQQLRILFTRAWLQKEEAPEIDYDFTNRSRSGIGF